MVGLIARDGWLMPALLMTVFLAAGYCAGALGRRLLGRLRRGVRMKPPWCELVTGALWAAAGGRVLFAGMPPAWLPVPLALAWCGVLLAATDVVCRRLPNALTLPAYPVTAVLLCIAACWGQGAALGVRAVGGALLFGAAHAAVHSLSPRSLGAGDVKLAGVLGAVLAAVSWPALALGAVLAALFTAAYGALRHMLRRRPAGAEHDPALPHGPGLIGAALLVALCADVTLSAPAP